MLATATVMVPVEGRLVPRLSLPAWVESLARLRGGTVLTENGVQGFWPSEARPMTTQEREQLEAIRQEISSWLRPGDVDQRKILELLSKMMLAYPTAGGGDEIQTIARTEIYLDAVGDVPGVFVAEALRLWARGEAGSLSDHGIRHELNYSFAPAPAVLRAICLKLRREFDETIELIDGMLELKPLLEILDRRGADGGESRESVALEPVADR